MYFGHFPDIQISGNINKTGQIGPFNPMEKFRTFCGPQSNISIIQELWFLRLTLTYKNENSFKMLLFWSQFYSHLPQILSKFLKLQLLFPLQLFFKTEKPAFKNEQNFKHTMLWITSLLLVNWITHFLKNLCVGHVCVSKSRSIRHKFN